MVAAKTARLDFRLDQEHKDRIERAAKLSSESISSFIVHAATTAADKVLARADVTVMPAEQFDELLRALDTADETSPLARFRGTERRYVRK